MRSWWAVFLLTSIFVPNTMADNGLHPDRQSELLREALNYFDQAVELVREDPTRAETLYHQAAADFETLIAAGLRNPALEYNLGNTYFRLGNLGRAILHYRRAKLLAPGDNAIEANLAYARNRVEPFIDPSGTQKLVTRLMFWTNHISIAERFRLTLIASLAGWLGLMLWLRWRSRPIIVLSILAIVLGLANSASIVWQLHDNAARPHAVIVDGEHLLRTGRGEAYNPVFDQPLGPGVELRLLNRRADWVEVQLPNEQTGWLPAAAVEKI